MPGPCIGHASVSCRSFVHIVDMHETDWPCLGLSKLRCHRSNLDLLELVLLSVSRAGVSGLLSTAGKGIRYSLSTSYVHPSTVYPFFPLQPLAKSAPNDKCCKQEAIIEYLGGLLRVKYCRFITLRPSKPNSNTFHSEQPVSIFSKVSPQTSLISLCPLAVATTNVKLMLLFCIFCCDVCAV